MKLNYLIIAALLCGCGGAVSTSYDPNLVGKVDDINNYDSPPVLLTAAVPEYPEMALEVGAEGKVLLKLLVLEDGTVGRIEVVEVSNPILVHEAITAASNCVFAPARKNGKPCRATTLLPILFDKDAERVRVRRTVETSKGGFPSSGSTDNPPENNLLK